MRKIFKGLFTLKTTTSSFSLTYWHLVCLTGVNQFPMAQPTLGTARSVFWACPVKQVKHQI